jgi:hypothetical protein
MGMNGGLAGLDTAANLGRQCFDESPKRRVVVWVRLQRKHAGESATGASDNRSYRIPVERSTIHERFVIAEPY